MMSHVRGDRIEPELREVDLGQSHVLNLRCSDIFQDSQCGLRLWESGIVLARYLLSLDLPSNLSILELGSGCGVAGLAASAYLAPSRIVLTDGNDRTVKNLKHNVADLPASPCGAKPTVQRLLWGVDPCPGQQRFDLVIGSDLFYSLEGARRLAVALDECLTGTGTGILVAPMDRLDENMARDDFKRAMMAKRFLIEEETVTFPSGVEVSGRSVWPCEGGGEFIVFKCRREEGAI
ncbi:hypothetical protein FOL47_003963 [Perkinsus chesapeaki]|uniref:Uncharacterized protein n=1 Tax=Perkinsus chesapeaki TaxID=330153 RepID=A0A7J6M650_PERCH|nr:hypothetical protein FOL47_003963 [Perkinsus chesapeaki]